MKRALDVQPHEVERDWRKNAGGGGQTNLSVSQRKAVQSVQAGENVFITGDAGTGKSHLIAYLMRLLRASGKVVLLAASTGVAAYQIGGVTLHRFGGIGKGTGDFQTLYNALARKPTRVKLWQQVDVLIVDEISMITTGYAKRLERIARLVRQNQRPMGGIQLVFVGDFLQCPAVTRPDDLKAYDDAEASLPLFESRLWRETWRIKPVVLRENFRQRGDAGFAALLGRLRLAKSTELDVETLRGRLLERHPHVDQADLIKLCSRRATAEAINREALDLLPGTAEVYKAVVTEYDVHGRPLKRKQDTQHGEKTRQPVDEEIPLKVGAKVLLCINLDVARGLYNGARGTVVEFRRSATLCEDQRLYPYVEFEGRGGSVVVEPHRWESVENKVVVSTFVQLPLTLRYALTIHKAQGLTLTRVLVTMDFFETGQGYVAHSRVRSLDDFYLSNVEMRHVRASENAVKYYTDNKLLL